MWSTIDLRDRREPYGESLDRFLRVADVGVGAHRAAAPVPAVVRAVRGLVVSVWRAGLDVMVSVAGLPASGGGSCPAGGVVLLSHLYAVEGALAGRGVTAKGRSYGRRASATVAGSIGRGIHVRSVWPFGHAGPNSVTGPAITHSIRSNPGALSAVMVGEDEGEHRSIAHGSVVGPRCLSSACNCVIRLTAGTVAMV